MARPGPRVARTALLDPWFYGVRCGTTPQVSGVPETCPVCGETVAVRNAVHVTVNTKTDAGILDEYVCRSCYRAELAPLVA